MNNSHKFFVCERCGNLVGLLTKQFAPLVCCGEKMKELVPNTVDASNEKHKPDYSFDASSGILTVKIGEIAHPMEDAHHISFVYVETENGGQRKCLEVEGKPEVSFSFKDDKPVAVYAYCNLHGLWKTDIA